MGEITIGQAAKRIGIPMEVLRDLCGDGYVSCRKGPLGHYYLDDDADELPRLPWIIRLYEQRFRDQLEDLLLAVKAVERELGEFEDAVEQAQLQDSGEPLGDPRLSMRVTPDYDQRVDALHLKVLHARLTWMKLGDLRAASVSDA